MVGLDTLPRPIAQTSPDTTCGSSAASREMVRCFNVLVVTSSSAVAPWPEMLQVPHPIWDFGDFGAGV